jgi:dephospho-CoA kinase
VTGKLAADPSRAGTRPAGKLVVGVTGGIGSGKTTVAKLFETLGAGLVDTDEIAHELTRAGQPAMEQIRKQFGQDYLDEEGALNRARMRALVFSDAQARSKLEAILHPLIRAQAQVRVESSPAAYVLLIVPLLVETGSYRGQLRRVLVVDCDEELQVTRVMRRGGLSEQQARAIIASQATREQRLLAADDVITNNAGLAELAEQVRWLHGRYLKMAARS